MSIGGSLSGISFTGLASGIDSQRIVDQLMQIEALPLQRMQRNQVILANKQSLFAQFKTLLSAFNSASSALNTAATFNPISSTSSKAEVATVAATSGASAGVYNLTVSKLATTHKVSSAAQSGATTQLGYSGTFVVNGRAVTVEATDTLTSIASKINSAGAGLTASVINGGTNNAYLTLTSSTSGAKNGVQIANLSGTALASLGIQTGAPTFRDQVGADTVRSYGFKDSSTVLSSHIGTTASGTFNIGTATVSVDFATDSLQGIADKINAEPLANATASVVTETVDGKTTSRLQIVGSGGALPTITDTSGLLEATGVYGRGFSNQLVAAQDAAYTVDGFSFTSSKNTVTDVVPGATITLLKANATTPETATLTLSRDAAKISTSMQDLKKAYNDVIDFIRGTTKFDTTTFESGPLFGDAVLTQVEGSLASKLFRDVGTGTVKNLAQVGFSFDADGKLEIDTAELDAAIASDPEAVRRLMMAVGDSTSNDLVYVSSTSATQSSVSGFQVAVTQVATLGNNLATVAQTSANTVGEKLTFNGALFNNAAYDLTVPIGADQAALVSAINNDAKLKDFVKASIDGSGLLKIESKKYGTAGNFSVVSDLAAAADNSGIGTSGGTVTNGLDVTGTINGKPATGTGQFLTGDAGSEVEGLQVQYKGTATGVVGTITYTRGIAAELTFGINAFTDLTTGLLTTTDKTLQDQIDDIGRRVESFQGQLDLRRAFLQQKFLAMERAVAAFQSQQAQLGAMLVNQQR